MGISPSDRTKQGDTRLHIAVKEENVTAVNTLLTKFHVDVNAANKRQETPLMLATALGNDMLFQLLLAHGANINKRNIKQCTVLHIALMYKRTTIAMQLLAFTNMAESQTREGDTPLHCAANHGLLPLVRLLCESGITLQHRNKEDFNALARCSQTMVIVNVIRYLAG